MNKSSRPVMTFRGGIHPTDNGKDLANFAVTRVVPLLEKYTVPVAENVGKPPIPIVKKGDKVKKYQLIAQPDGFVSAALHSPTSGEVAGIIEIPGSMGVPVQAIEIVSDGADEAGELMTPFGDDWRSADPKELLGRVGEAGIVGMGGASFPTHVKLSPPPNKPVDTLILNGAECEPYLTADHRLMAENPFDVLEGAAIIGRILGVTRLFIGIEINKRDAIRALEQFENDYGVRVMPLRVQYPQGSEKQLINAITGRVVPAGGLPMDAGCVVQNVGTAAAITAAVKRGIPLVDRITTVTGDVVKYQGNFRLKIGTPALKAVEFAGGVTEEPGKLIFGGPMMGFAQRSFNVPIAKNTSGILLLPQGSAQTFHAEGCIRCGRCVQGCPMHLVTCLLATAIEAERYDLAEQNHVMDCLECGSCAYVCPAKRPLVQHIRRAKQEIRRKMRNSGGKK